MASRNGREVSNFSIDRDFRFDNTKTRDILRLPRIPSTNFNFNPEARLSYNLINDKLTYSNGLRWLTITDDGRNRIFDAVVDPTGIGDFLKLSEAVNAGKTNIYIRKGTYTETSQINISVPTVITGEDLSSTQIIFSGLTAPAFNIEGGNIETAGTISIVNGSSTIIGVGTTFTNLSAGNLIMFAQIPYVILSIINDTTLTLTVIYRGLETSGNEYIAGNFITTVVVQNLTIINSSTTPCTSNGIYFNAVNQGLLLNIFVLGFVDNIFIEESIITRLNNILIQSSSDNGLKISDSISIQLINIGSTNNIGHGLDITGVSIGSKNIIISRSLFNNNGGNGIIINGGGIGATESVNLVSTQSEFNSGTGIRSTNNTNRIIMDQCIMRNNNTGTSLGGSLNTISNCIISNNINTGIEAGDEGIIIGNYCNNNGENGIHLMGDSDNTITGNNIFDNLDSGINLTAFSENNTISGNNIFANVNFGIDLSGGGSAGNNIVSGNKIRDNTITDIRVSDNDNCITGNHISNGGSGVGIEVNNDNICITGNRITGHTTGITITGTADDTLITGNQLKGNTAAISDSGTGTITSGNIV